MQSRTQTKPTVGIIFDSDMGEQVDTALALAMLFGFDGKNEIRVSGLSVSKANLKAAAFCDAVRNFYASATNPRFRGFFRGLPVGLSTEGKMPADTPLLTAPLSKQASDGTPAYERFIESVNDTAEVAPLLRNALTATYDANAIVVLAGPATNLARLLEVRGASELIASKVRYLSFAGGKYPDGSPESRVQADISAAKKLFAEWPTPIIAAGQEVGDALKFPAASIEQDFAWSTSHPVVDAYRAYKSMPYDASTCAMAAMLYAVRPKEGYFKLSNPGTISVRDDGRTEFRSSADGKHQYLIVDPDQKERVIKTYTELASAKPVPRQPRFRLPDEPKPKPKPEAEAKQPATP